MQNTCESACQEAAKNVANIECRDLQGNKKDNCVKNKGGKIFNKCILDNKKTKCDCKGKCQIAANYRCKYDKLHRNKFKNDKDCFTYSNKECNDKMSCNTNKDVLKSMNSAELENEGDVEGDAEGDTYEEDVTKCTCPCCMKGGCGRRGYSSIWYTLFIILIVLLFIFMFASLVYDGKKRI